jgi:putative protease
MNQGFNAFRLNNLGHFPLFDSLEGVRLATGYRLFSLNTQAILAWGELGAKETCLYIEDDRDNLRELLARNVEPVPALMAYGQVHLITSRIAIRGVRADSPVLSDRGDAYRVDGRSGVTVVAAETDFSLLGCLHELQQMGCGRFILDLSHLGPFSPGGKKVLESAKAATDPPGTSRFNYEAGLQ